jgi:uncharacterized membrane protein YbhN (UPF0104 family)
VRWTPLAAGVGCHVLRLLAISRAWRNIIKGAYPKERVRWRSIVAAQFAGVGVNAIVPARGGDAARVVLARRALGDSSIATLASTLVLLTLFDFVVAGALVLWALAAGLLPGTNVLRRFHSFDFGWVLDHPGRALLVVVIVLLLILMVLLWFAENLLGVWGRLKQGFAILRDKRAYLRKVALWQTADWTLRIVTLLWFLSAFGLPATLYNAVLVQVSQSLAGLIPLSPGGIGTEQAMLLYLFRGKAGNATLLGFSVGVRVTLIVVNLALGIGAFLVTFRTLRWRDHVAASRAR